MTTSYPAQTQTFKIPTGNHIPLHAGQEPSPASSASPTSPRMNEYLQHAPNPAKQLRPLKSPLYVPAVLRPNDYYSQSPLTPPKSLHGSLDSLQQQQHEGKEDAVAAAQRELDLALQQSFASGDDALSDVTGPPTREHWKPDEASTSCDSPSCRSSFNLFLRKHHCRHCGHIFCSAHTNFSIPLDQDAQFHPGGVSSRACETCHRQYQRWDTARSVRRKDSAHSDGSSDASGDVTPVVDAKSGHRRMISSRGGQAQQAAAVPNSVPKDWAWSTF